VKLYKRNKTYWTDFSVHGHRFRVSLDTTNRSEATSLAHEKIAQAKQGKLSAKSQSFARLTFTDAAEKYLQSRKLEMQASSFKKEAQLLIQPKLYFGVTRLNRISAEQVLAYREQRAATCGPAFVNTETE
jgi:hypothetical protein